MRSETICRKCGLISIVFLFVENFNDRPLKVFYSNDKLSFMLIYNLNDRYMD